MSIVESIKVALDSLIANKMRSFLTMLGVIIGVAAVILLVSIGQGVTSSITKEIEELGSNILNVVPGRIGFGQGKGSIPTYENKLTYKEALLVEKEVKGIVGVTPVIEANLNIKYKNDTRRVYSMGVTPDFPKVRNWKVVQGRFFSLSHVNGAKRVVGLGQTVINDLFGEEKAIGKRVVINGQKFKIIGIMEKKGSFMGMDMDDIAFVPITVIERLTGLDKLSGIVVQVKKAESVKKVSRQIERVLLKRLSRDDFTVMSQEAMLSALQRVLGTLTLMLGGLAGISLLVGGIGIMNIMLVSVTERTREIGIRKAVGAKTYDIMLQFIVESVFLSLFGGAIGILVGYLGSLAIEKFLVATEVTPWSVVLAFLFSASVGIFFGVYPAYRAAKVDPIIALRYE